MVTGANRYQGVFMAENSEGREKTAWRRHSVFAESLKQSKREMTMRLFLIGLISAYLIYRGLGFMYYHSMKRPQFNVGGVSVSEGGHIQNSVLQPKGSLGPVGAMHLQVCNIRPGAETADMRLTPWPWRSSSSLITLGALLV